MLRRGVELQRCLETMHSPAHRARVAVGENWYARGRLSSLIKALYLRGFLALGRIGRIIFTHIKN
jgi:hypothetical protein